MAQWTTAYVNSLPNSSFAFVSGSIRKLPYKDKDGNVDLPHLRNALERLDQTQGIPVSEKAAIKAKLEKVLADANKSGDKMHALPDDMIAPFTSPMKLDANGDLPQRFPVLTTGHWPNSIKGDFKVTLDILKAIKQKFDAGMGFPTEDASTGLCVNFEHDIGGAAGAWAKGLELEADEEKNTGTLFATNLEYTDEGEKAIRSGRYKGISAEGSLAYVNGKMKEIPHHLNLGEKLSAVMTGLAFTNLPYMSMMAPVRLSALPESDDSPLVVLLKDKENDAMNLDALRVKENKDVTSEERQFLTANKDKLSADELKRFELEALDTLSAEDRELLAAVKSGSKKVVDNNNDNDGDEDVSAEDRQTLADIKSGKKKLVDAGEKLDALTQDDRDMLTAIQSGKKKVVDADMLSKLDKLGELETVAAQFKHDKAKQFVREQLSRGALKPDQEETTVTMLLSLEGDARKAFEDHLSALPSNELLAAEIGHDKEVNVDIADELKQKTLEVQSKAKTGGETLSYAQAQDRLMRDDADIKQRYEASKTGK